MASLEGLPGDVMAHILELLPASDLARLRLVSRIMDRRVSLPSMSSLSSPPPMEDEATVG